MRLFFLRHAEAGDAPVDAARELTAKGRRDARRAGRFLAGLGVAFDRAYTSPLVRARQTADLVVARCPVARGGRLEVVDELLNGTTAAGFRRWLASLPEAESVLLVGHEPSLGAWVRGLIGLSRAAGLPLSKGAVARVDTDDRRAGVLKFLVNPRQMT